MATRKHSDYLDVGLTDEEQSNHSADDFEDSRTTNLQSRSSKRRKVDHSAGEDEADFSDEEEGGDKEDIIRDGALEPEAASNDAFVATRKSLSKTNSKLKPLTKSQLAASQLRARKTGVIYLSRIPPFMRPSTLKHLLTPYGTINRLFLTPEPAASYARRLKGGGNKKRSFVDGWVEFASKKHAKICAETLNGEIIGGKKGGWYHDDIWNIKYLRGFKWSDLMEQVQGEERMREGRMRAELQKEMRERKVFLGNVEMAKKEAGMEAKRKTKEERKVIDGGNGPRAGVDNAEPVKDTGKRRKHERRFRQSEVRVRDTDGKSGAEQPEHVTRVLSKIF